MPVEVQLQPFDVLYQRRERRAHLLTCRRRVEVRRKQNLLLRQICDQHRIAVLEANHMMKLDRARLILQHHLLYHALDLRFPLRFGQPISDQRARRQQRLLDEVLAVVVGQDDHPFGTERRQPAHVIEVRVCVDDVFDALVRKQLLHFRDHGQSAGFTLSALEHDHVVAELNGQRNIAACHAIDTFGELLCCDGAWGRRRWCWRRGR